MDCETETKVEETTGVKAVSPVIGVVVMTAIVVVLSALVLGLLSGSVTGGDSTSVPSVDVEITTSDSGSIVVRHKGGESMDADHLRFTGYTEADAFTDENTVTAGETDTLTPSGTGKREVALVWEKSGTSQVLAREVVEIESQTGIFKVSTSFNVSSARQSEEVKWFLSITNTGNSELTRKVTGNLEGNKAGGSLTLKGGETTTQIGPTSYPVIGETGDADFKDKDGDGEISFTLKSGNDTDTATLEVLPPP